MGSGVLIFPLHLASSPRMSKVEIVHGVAGINWQAGTGHSRADHTKRYGLRG